MVSHTLFSPHEKRVPCAPIRPSVHISGWPTPRRGSFRFAQPCVGTYCGSVCLRHWKEMEQKKQTCVGPRWENVERTDAHGNAKLRFARSSDRTERATDSPVQAKAKSMKSAHRMRQKWRFVIEKIARNGPRCKWLHVLRRAFRSSEGVCNTKRTFLSQSLLFPRKKCCYQLESMVFAMRMARKRSFSLRTKG